MRSLLASILVLSPVVAMGDLIVPLQNGTATFSQGGEDLLGPYSPDEAVNGIGSPPVPGDGWSVARPGLSEAFAETAVWETAFDLTTPAIRFDLEMINFIGHFRFSVTTDDRSTFADGLDTGGDVNANWTVLTDAIVSELSGTQFLINVDNGSVLVDVNSPFPQGGTVSVRYNTPLSGVTGIRLEALEHFSLPHFGPGLSSTEGNFLLYEMTLTAVPEPSSLLVLCSIAPLVMIRSGRKSSLLGNC